VVSVVVLAALHPAAAATTRTLCATLGDDQPPSLLDQDIFRFTGTTGETVTLTLEADSAGVQTGDSNAISLRTCIALSSSGGEGTVPGQRGGRAWERFPRPGRYVTAEVPTATPVLTHLTQRRR
jgi:hypothetical protein